MNEVVTATKEDTLGPSFTTGSLSIGAYLNGRVDDVAIYDHALSQPRLEAHFTAGN